MTGPRPREKLIRDRIPDLVRDQGGTLALRKAEPGELARLLGLKLLEESHEVLEALQNGNADSVLDELADVQTVIDALACRYGLTRELVSRRVRDKREERGDFEGGLVLREHAISGPRLHVGRGSTLLDALRREFESCAVARIAVAFVMQSGLDLIEGPALAALLRGAHIRWLTTDYLGVTEPEALERLCHWHGRIESRVYRSARRSFHPKAYLFERPDGSGRAFIGSSNLSRSGLTEGVEWTWTVLDVDSGAPMHELATRFEELFAEEDTQPLSPAWIQDYVARRVVKVTAEPPAHYGAPSVQPREAQRLALQELSRLRSDGERRALVVAATGLGKTYLAAFDAADAERVLFIAHREELLRQAELAFATLYPERSRGFVAEGRAEYGRDVVFASIQTLSRPEHLGRTEFARFDYVVIDEFHHAAAQSYTRVLASLTPRFLLGLTATPFRSDNYDLLELCDGNLAYQVGLFEAIAFGWLVPFRYHGVADVVSYSDDLLTSRKTYDTAKLTLRYNTPERTQAVMDQFRRHASQAALGFCVSIDHADFMARAFVASGIPAAAVHSGPGSMERTAAIDALCSGNLQVLFTVDLFNEGVDLPAVDLVMFLRPTESLTVFLQQLGRGLRLHPGKQFLTVLDFIGNYRNAHYKLPLLMGQDLSQDQNPRRALAAWLDWQQRGVRPDSVPEGVEISLDPVALSTLREALQRASPLKSLVLSNLDEVAQQIGRAPSLREWQQLGQYSLRTARTALGVDRWCRVLDAAGLLAEEDRELDAEVGEFLRELETTSMTKSFKMVMLLGMTDGQTFRQAVPIADLVARFRAYFSEERHREDVLGTDVEEVATVAMITWRRYLEINPIRAWTGGNTGLSSPYFAWHAASAQFRYTGARPSEEARQTRFARAVLDRALARLDHYWSRPGPGRHVYSVIPTGQARTLEGSATESSRSYCVMLGENRAGLPVGWHLVSINGRHLYGKFVKVALNVLKSQPTDEADTPNVLTQELRELFGGVLAPRRRVRVTRQPGAAVWEINRA